MSAVLYDHEIHCTCSAGASLHAVVLEGSMLALRESRIVKFAFNDVDIVIDPKKIIGAIMNEWDAAMELKRAARAERAAL